MAVEVRRAPRTFEVKSTVGGAEIIQTSGPANTQGIRRASGFKTSHSAPQPEAPQPEPVKKVQPEMKVEKTVITPKTYEVNRVVDFAGGPEFYEPKTGRRVDTVFRDSKTGRLTSSPYSSITESTEIPTDANGNPVGENSRVRIVSERKGDFGQRIATDSTGKEYIVVPNRDKKVGDILVVKSDYDAYQVAEQDRLQQAQRYERQGESKYFPGLVQEVPGYVFDKLLQAGEKAGERDKEKSAISLFFPKRIEVGKELKKSEQEIKDFFAVAPSELRERAIFSLEQRRISKEEGLGTEKGQLAALSGYGPAVTTIGLLATPLGGVGVSSSALRATGASRPVMNFLAKQLTPQSIIFKGVEAFAGFQAYKNPTPLNIALALLPTGARIARFLPKGLKGAAAIIPKTERPVVIRNFPRGGRGGGFGIVNEVKVSSTGKGPQTQTTNVEVTNVFTPEGNFVKPQVSATNTLGQGAKVQQQNLADKFLVKLFGGPRGAVVGGIEIKKKILIKPRFKIPKRYEEITYAARLEEFVSGPGGKGRPIDILLTRRKYGLSGEEGRIDRKSIVAKGGKRAFFDKTGYISGTTRLVEKPSPVKDLIELRARGEEIKIIFKQPKFMLKLPEKYVEDLKARGESYEPIFAENGYVSGIKFFRGFKIPRIEELKPGKKIGDVEVSDRTVPLIRGIKERRFSRKGGYVRSEIPGKVETISTMEGVKIIGRPFKIGNKSFVKQQITSPIKREFVPEAKEVSEMFAEQPEFFKRNEIGESIQRADIKRMLNRIRKDQNKLFGKRAEAVVFVEREKPIKARYEFVKGNPLKKVKPFEPEPVRAEQSPKGPVAKYLEEKAREDRIRGTSERQLQEKRNKALDLNDLLTAQKPRFQTVTETHLVEGLNDLEILPLQSTQIRQGTLPIVRQIPITRTRLNVVQRTQQFTRQQTRQATGVVLKLKPVTIVETGTVTKTGTRLETNTKTNTRLQPILQVRPRTAQVPARVEVPTTIAFPASRNLSPKKRKALRKLLRVKKGRLLREQGTFSDLLSINISTIKFGRATPPAPTRKNILRIERQLEREGGVGLFPTQETKNLKAGIRLI